MLDIIFRFEQCPSRFDCYYFVLQKTFKLTAIKKFCIFRNKLLKENNIDIWTL